MICAKQMPAVMREWILGSGSELMLRRSIGCLGLKGCWDPVGAPYYCVAREEAKDCLMAKATEGLVLKTVFKIVDLV